MAQVRAQACGAENQNRPKDCCEGLVCSDAGANSDLHMKCIEPTIEDVIESIVEEMTPTTEAPVGSPTASPTMSPSASPTLAPIVSGRLDICAGDNERAVTCGADNADRPHNCCAGFVCSDNTQGKRYACVPAPPTPRPTLPPTTAAPVTASPSASPVVSGTEDGMISVSDLIEETATPATPEEEEPVTGPVETTIPVSTSCGMMIDTKCFVHEPHQVEAVDCRAVNGTAHSAGELLDVTWSYTLTNTCQDEWTVVARQNLNSCELCLGSGLKCNKEVDFFQPTATNCAVLDSTGRYLGFPPGCSITENVFNEIKVGSEEDGRCIYNKEINIRVIDGEVTAPVALKYSFVAPMPFN